MCPGSGLPSSPYRSSQFLFLYWSWWGHSVIYWEATYPMMHELQPHFKFWVKGSRRFFEKGPWLWNSSPDYSQCWDCWPQGHRERPICFLRLCSWRDVKEALWISRDWLGFLRHVCSAALWRIIHDDYDETFYSI